MADEADRAQAGIEEEIAAAISRRKDDGGLMATGFCHYCAEVVAGGRLFCDRECADEWHRERHLRAQKI